MRTASQTPGRLWRVHPAYAGVMCQSRSSASVAERVLPLA